MDRDRRVAAEALLDHDPLGPREPGRGLAGDAIVAADEADRHAPGPEGDRVQPALADRPPVQAGGHRPARVRVGDRAQGIAGPGVIADEEGHPEAAVRAGPGDHRPGLLALDDARPGIEVDRGQVVHPAVAVVDHHLGGPAPEGAVDRRVRLPDHQGDRGRVLDIAAVRRGRMADPGDPFHVDADVGLHDSSSAGPDRAGLPIQTWPSANCSAFQMGARALSSSMA